MHFLGRCQVRDLVLKQVVAAKGPQENRNKIRRFLQILVLKLLHESTSGSALAFTGGTALHFLFGLPRFSEDLDFSLVRPEKYDFESFIQHLQTGLSNLNLPADLKSKSEKNVHHVYCRFREILYEAGLTPHPDEKLPIRIEIDVNPPKGWKTQLSLLSEVYTFPIQHFDLPSMFATKLHACLYRPYTKGRDFYDLMWYLGKKIRPNFMILNNAIAQTEKNHEPLDGEKLKDRLCERVATLTIAQLKKDVEPFLAHPEELNLFDEKLMTEAIANYRF